MNAEWKNALQQRFRDYAYSVAVPEPDMAMPYQLKINHTMDVCSIMDRIIAETKGILPEQEKLFWLSALFHDVSRFEQLRDYKTFQDAKSFDHGQRSAEIFLRDFVLPELTGKEMHIIADALRYHNKLKLPEGLDAETIGPAKAIRDADKISILKIFIAHYEAGPTPFPDVVSFGLPDTPGFTEELVYAAIRGEAQSFHKMKNINDFKLHIYCWSSDINYPAAAQIILDEKIYERSRSFLPESPLIDQAQEASLNRLRILAGKKE